MTIQTSIIKGLLASTSLLAGSGAVAAITTTYDYPVYELHNTVYTFHKPVYGAGHDSFSFQSASDIGRISKADIAKAILVFNYGISQKLISPEAKHRYGNWWLAAWDQSNAAKKPGNGGDGYFDTAKDAAKQATPVPEPATLALFGLGLAGIGLTKRRARKDEK